MIIFCSLWNVAAAQTVPPYPYLACDSFWLLNNKVCNKPPTYLNFDPSGLSSAAYGMKLIDTAATPGDTTRWIRSYVNRSQPQIGLSYRDEFKVRTIELGDTGVNLRFFNFIYHAVDYRYENRNSLWSQWKYGQYYPQVSFGMRPIGGVYKPCVVIQTDTTTPGTTTFNSQVVYPIASSNFVSDMDVEVLFEMNWGWTYQAWTKVYIDGVQQQFNIGGVMMDSIPGANMDMPYNPAQPSYPPFRLGQYQFTWSNIPTPPIYPIRTVLFRRVIVGRNNMSYTQFTSGDAPTPYIIATDSVLAVSGYVVGGTGIGSKFILQGQYLSPTSGSVTVTAPTDYEVSITSANVGFSGSVSIAYSAGILAPRNVWVRLKAGRAVGSYSQVVAVSGGSAATTVDVSAAVTAAPVIPPVTSTSGGQAPVIFLNQ